VLTEGAIQEIVKEAALKKTGARGLRAIMEKKLANLMFEIPSMERAESVLINERAIKGEEEPIIKRAPLLHSAPSVKKTKSTKAKKSVSLTDSAKKIADA
jgi:ATP-dependent Clp protease ATP-binding subunit ClpX